MPPPNFDLLLVTDRKLAHGTDLLRVVEQALDGGVTALQLREKDLGGKELLHLAEKCRSLCDRYHAQLYINDRVDVALVVDAAGVQLGKASLPIETARALLGPGKTIGMSTHGLDEALEAQRSGADFILFGPIYYTPSKASYGDPQGLASLKEIVRSVALPVYAIGGIKAENLAATLHAGIRGIAVISAIIAAPDPAQATGSILQMIKPARNA